MFKINPIFEPEKPRVSGIERFADIIETQYLVEQEGQKAAILLLNRDRMEYHKGKVAAYWEIIQMLESGEPLY